MFDTHIHTEVSTDSKMKLLDALKSAKEKGVSLILTEHMDIQGPIEEYGHFTFDSEEYFKKYDGFRGDNLLLGMEMGMSPEFLKENKREEEKSPFDYVIGSVHVVNTIDIFREEFYAERTKKNAYEEYLEYMLRCLKQYDFIDSLGHIDYICRYATYEDPEIYYEEFSDYIDEILKVLIEKEKAMELNTRRLSTDKARESLINIYKRYKDLGGTYITIGSDSHKESAIAMNFNYALEIVEKCNLKQVYFKNRKIEYDK